METNTCLYFAYGSNMDPSQMRRRIPDARVVGRATLKGWRIAERLYADIEKERGGRVYGILYLLSVREMRRLDAYEGYPRTYECGKVVVHAEVMGSRSVRYRVPAYTYFMTKEARRTRNGRRYPESYRATCAAGARYWGLPSAFGKKEDGTEEKSATGARPKAASISVGALPTAKGGDAAMK